MLDRGAKLGASFAVIAAAFYGWYHLELLWEQESQKRKDRSYAFYQEYGSEAMSKAIRIVKHEMHPEFVRSRNNSLPETVVAQSCLIVLLPLDSEQQLVTEGQRQQQRKHCKALHVVLNFFDNAYNCVKWGSCDKEAMISLLRKEADVMWNVARPFIDATMALDYLDYGNGLSCIHDNFRCDDDVRSP